MSEDGNKKRILDVATRLFSTQGLKTTNIRQIASEAKANSALIFYYFGCKEKLFFECLKDLASERFQVSKEILSAPSNTQDFELKLNLFVQNMHAVFLTKADLIKILHRELDNENKLALKVFEEHMLPVTNNLEDFFVAAQKKKIIAKDLDAKALTFDFMALIANPLRNEAIFKTIFKKELSKLGAPALYKENQKRVVSLFLKGVLSHENV